ncbi:ABC transporter substrate-binding protein [Planosporangium thailandense]|uniref:ABC transporter substrate-binding protein n=1 Tax=Planosporangium thailandense TaxID=765197 RepID=A0ABX0Y1R4_9ACTN|nr:ABC transporter substrate-binding protein [Planosporangium thailandense]NJC71375.1 ABC transporter substrate-binding protein [Planosporangium thailandense]
MARRLPLRSRGAAALALCALGLSLLGACGSSDGSKDAAASNKAPLYSALPKDVQKAGAINVGSSVDYPPFEYYAADGKTLQGFETELAALLEKQLGVTFKWNNASFDTLFSALRANRYDVVYGATNDTAEREKTFDFVYYLQSSQGFVVGKGNPQGIKVLDDICGKSIAAVRGGVQAQFLDKQAAECDKAGKGKLDILTFAGNADEQLAVKQGRAAALLENYPTAATFAKESNGELELVPNLQVEKRFYGMVINKDNTQLRDTLAKAWQAIIDDGSYGKVLDKWGLSEIGVKKAGVNAVQTGANAG